MNPTDQTFRVLVESLEDYAIFLLDPDGVVRSWNAGARRINGYEADEIVGRHVSVFHAPADRAWERGLASAREQGRFEDVGWRIRKDGTPLRASVVLTALHDDAGTVIGFAKVMRELNPDGSVREGLGAAELEGERAMSWWETTLRSIGDAVIATDARGTVMFINPVAEAMTGWAMAEAHGRSLPEVFPIVHEETRAPAESPVDRVLREGAVVGPSSHTVLLHRDGTARAIDDRAVPIRRPDGTLDGIVLVFRDVSLEQREAARRRRLEEEAMAASRVKDELFSMLGHELRNPLAPIRTALNLMALRSHADTAKERQVIEQQVDHMVRLVDDLLDVSRITRGMIELRRQPTEVGAAIVRAVEMASPLLEQRRHHLDLEVPREGLAVDADPARLAQVFANLLTNAAKYTDPGGHIAVAAARADREIEVTVRDTGAGIAPESLPSLFEAFVQERRQVERSQGGLGLGLSIVRSLVTMHGGTVTAHSDGRGRGAAFTVRLPALDGAIAAAELAAAELAAAAPSEPSASRCRILLVDDNEDAAALLSEILTNSGYDVRTAFDGPSALALARQLEPEVAILDLGLPVMDGYELASELQALLEARAPRMIALTGYGQEQGQQRAAAAGFARYLVKPIAFDALRRAIDELLAP